MRYSRFYFKHYDKPFYCSLARSELPSKRAAWKRDSQKCVELLGAGAFGIVGKWCKFDSSGRVVDILAVKQHQCTSHDADITGRPVLPGEIALPDGLQNQGCKNIPRIRSEVYFDCINPQWRVHSEFCPYATLEDLVETYRKLNGRHRHVTYFVPEAFIWYAFLGFAMAYRHMSTFRVTEICIQEQGKHFILHMDLKGANVLLGNKDDDPDELPYPVVKIADWGLAEYTSVSDPDNPRKWRGNGTICWMPPEQINSCRYGEDWEFRVLGGPNRPYTHKHVIWQMAANIYGLMEQDLHNQKLQYYVQAAESQESRLRRHRYSCLFGYRNRNYSTELCELGEDCLSIKPGNRPEPLDLIHKAVKGLEKYQREFRQTKKFDKLYLST